MTPVKYSVSASRSTGLGGGAPAGVIQRVEIGSDKLATMEDAQREKARFPKSVKARAYPVSGAPEGMYYRVSMQVQLIANGVNGGRNETGVKRYRTARRVIGDAAVWTMPYSNSVTEAEFEAEVR